ncbi:osmoprotectant transporter permease [Emticicia sp. SJ17W-69]|uniref:osmoprotectant transporter permease n=1 Tax=Emticicia sp. SJ17W-69 TaxID=3421657 RepID=UPI003EBD3E25
MIIFWIFWGIDAIVGLILLYFFFIGLADGSVSSFNIGLWLLLLIVSISLLMGSLYLKSKEKFVIAKILLGIEAIPAFFFFLFFLLMILSKPNWQ